MFRLTSVAAAMLAGCLVAVSASAQERSSSAAQYPPPKDAKAAKLYAKGMKDSEDRKYLAALDDFRRADQQDGGRCLACERQAYRAAILTQDYKSAHEQAALLLDHVTDPEAKAEMHFLLGDACLGEGGNRIFEKPFSDADKEFQAALAIQPGNADCLYKDGVALAHLHQYDKAQERFQQYLKLGPSAELQYARARLFAAQPELARKRVAPSFNVVSLDNKPISMQSLAGKVVLIDFWATWCGPCKQALPHIKELVHKFQGQPLVVISISLDEDEATWKNFVQSNGMTWLQYRDGSFDGPISSAFGVKAIPTTFSIDADGFVQDQQVGQGNIEEKLQQMLTHIADAKKQLAVIHE